MKKFLYDLLENKEIISGKKLLFDIFLTIMVIVSISLIFLENEKGVLSPTLATLDHIINTFFIAEFILRFYVVTNFRQDYKEKGLFFAIKHKLSWFTRLTTIIDFLAIIPAVEYFRVFRTLRFLRFLRFLRLLRLHRSIKLFRDIDRVWTVLKGMTADSRTFYIFFSFTVFFTVILSFALYMSESALSKGEFTTFKDSVWYSIKVIGLGDDTPATISGKIFASLLLLANMAIFSFFVSIIVTKIQSVTEAIASGKIGSIKLENHIVICGYSTSSMRVIEYLLKDKNNQNNIVLITEKEIKDNLKGVIYLGGNFTQMEVLEQANVKAAKYAVVFAESKPQDTNKDIDLRTILTIFYIEKINPDVHTIAEINEEINAEMIKDTIQGDEILYKEKIDAMIISTCIKHKNLTPMIYDLLDQSETEHFAETTLAELGFSAPVSAKELKLLFVEKDAAFLGFIDKDNNAVLSPKNDTLITDDVRIIYIQ